jgi:hypothetical protein
LTRNQKKHWSGCNLLVVRIQDHWNIWHGADGKKPKATPKGATSQRSDGQGRGVGRQCVPIKHIQNIVFRTLGVAGPTEDGMGSPIGMECEAPNLMKYVGDLVNLPLAINISSENKYSTYKSLETSCCFLISQKRIPVNLARNQFREWLASSLHLDQLLP